MKDWLNKAIVYQFTHFIPQHYYVAKGRKILVDKVYRFEEMDEAIADLGQKLSIQIENKHVNKTSSREKDYRKYYTKESAKIVADVYREDIEMFGYEF